MVLPLAARSLTCALALAALSLTSCGSEDKKATGTWTKLAAFVPMGTAAYHDIAFVSDSVGYVVGGYTFLGKTTDGGKSWTKLDVKAVPEAVKDGVFRVVQFRSETDGWIAGTGWLLHTTDGGANWTQKMPADMDRAVQAPWGLAFADAQHGVVVGLYGKALYTADGGETWEKIITDTDFTMGESGADFHAVQFINPNIGFIAGSRSTLLKTIDGGKTWATISGPRTNVTQTLLGDSWKVQFFDENNGHVGGPGGMLRTTDGGKTWTKGEGSSATHTFFFVDPSLGYSDDAAMNALAVTTNGGASWSSQKVDSENATLFALHFRGRRGWALIGTGDLFGLTP